MNNIWLTWGDVFNASLQNLWWGLVQFAPNLIIAIFLFIIGWVLGGMVAKALEQVFSVLKVDKLLSSVGAEGFFRKAGMDLDSGHFIGQLVKWFVVVVFLLPSLSLVGLDGIALFLKDVVLGFLPRVVIVAFILIIATFTAEALSKVVLTSTKTVSLSSANMLGVIAKYSVWIFALTIALGELGIAEDYMKALFYGIIAMLSVAGALAFGLGGRDAAARFIDKVSGEMSNH